MSARFVVDLDVFAQNLRTVRDTVAPAEHMLVLKDDAYRHGLREITMRAWQEGVRWFGALDVATGSQVRDLLGAEARIFAWMLIGDEDPHTAVAARLDIGVGSAALLEQVAEAASAADACALVHLKIDTGLHRNGVRPEDWEAFVARAAELESTGAIRVAGIWSHIAEASDAEDDASRAVFDAAVAQARAAGLNPERLHLAASAASFARPEFRYDMVRVGAFAYGIRPSDGPSDADLGVAPVGELRADISRVRTRSVTVDAGSATGLPSIAAGRFRAVPAALAEAADSTGCGVEVIEIGPESMQLASWTGAREHDEVVLFGRAPAASATDIAEQLGTIGEEIVLRLGADVPVEYVAR